MISAKNATMLFNKTAALNNLTCNISKGCIYGLVGSNGAGKSTFLRLISGIYRPTSGGITIEGEEVYDNPSIKNRVAFVPDDLFFLPGADMSDMESWYADVYKNFNRDRFHKLLSTFKLPYKKSINKFSKGMKRLGATILAISTMPDYLFFDETFDGLDPVMRANVKQVIYNDVAERNTTVIITSHSLRELEDTCDRLALLHKGGIVFESDIQNLKTSLFKVQIGFSEPFTKEKFKDVEGMEILSYKSQGSVSSFIVKGEREDVAEKLSDMNPLFLDVLPLNLEEVFVYEMEALGYAFKDLLM